MQTSNMRIRAGRSFLLLLFLIQFLQPGVTTAEEISGSPEGMKVEVRVEPAARTTVFNKVILMPLQQRGNRTNPVVTEALYRQIQGTNKYSLLPQDIVVNWLKDHPATTQDSDPVQIGITAARALRARGIIVGSISWEKPEKPIAGETTKSNELKLSIQMFDAQTTEQVWSLDLSIPQVTEPANPEEEQLRLGLVEGVQQLLARMVQQGDIFSTQLAKPRILSKQGRIRSVRVVLQPEPPHIHKAYQLLRSNNRDTVFTPVAPPVINDRGPLILTDKNLQDGMEYYYTIIGINSQGLANIPELPFTISTTGPPMSVTGFQASGSGLRQIQLSWEPPHDPDIEGYSIYRSSTASGPFAQIATIDDRDKQSYIDRGTAQQYERYGKLDDNTEYFYTIRSRNTVAVESKSSPVVSATTKGAPLPPANVQATNRQPRRIPLSWEAATDPHVKGYALFRSDTMSGPYQQIAVIEGWQTLEYVDRGDWNTPLADNTTYFYRIQAVNVVDNRSTFSVTTSATTKPAPVAVSGIKLSKGQFRCIELSWEPNPEADITRYEIFRGSLEDTISQSIAIIDSPETSYLDKGLEDGRTYWYQIQAVDQDRLYGTRSDAKSGSTKPVPGAPQGLLAEVTENGLVLTWDANPEKDITAYQVHSTGFLASEIGQTDQTRYQVESALDPDAAQTFQIRAIDADGLTSPFSEPVTITPPRLKPEQAAP